MSEDLAFRIQLGIILPKMKDTIAGDLSKIVDELVDILKAGTREGEELSIEPIKEIIMKDLDILLDDFILPDIEAKLKPPEEDAAEEIEEAAEEEEEEKAEE
jgi:flagellar biosynthesis/type III secretory pathway chaperone